MAILTTAKKETIQGDIQTVRRSSAEIRKAINRSAPVLVEAIRAGESASLANQLMAACTPSLRIDLSAFFAAHTGHKMVIDGHKHRVGKKLTSDKSHEKIAENWAEFRKSGQTVMTWIEMHTLPAQKEAAEITAETIRSDLQKVVKKSGKIAMTGDQLLAMLAEVVAADAEKAAAKAA